MHDFEVTVWPDHSHYNIEVCLDCSIDLFTLNLGESRQLLNCVAKMLDGGECSHTLVHRIIAKPGGKYMVLFSASERLSKAYIVNRSKLLNLKTRLMREING